MAPVFSMLAQAALLAGATAAAAPSASPLVTSRTVNVIVTLRDGTSASLAAIEKEKFPTREKRITKLRDTLENHARKSQAEVQDVLSKAERDAFSEYESFWITNQVVVRGMNPKLIEKLKALPSVVDVALEQVHAIIAPVFQANGATTAATTTTPPSLATAVSWGVSKIKAPTIWNAGDTGANIVVGTIDTGVRATHQALAKSFRSSFGWYDPEKKAAKPYDATGHGTHVVGTIVGGYGVGVAPGAQWIACKGCRSVGCYSSELLACFQFMLCPTTPDGKVKDCTKAPRVVNNSWAAGQGSTTFNTAVQAWKTAGIIPVFAAGNNGPACSTVNSPGDMASVIAVGATDSNDALASYSSKGPSINGVTKPDVSAPGSLVRSSCYTSDTAYCTMSGSSMAAPHVTGTIALYLSAKPTATYEQVQQYLQSTAATSTLAKTGYACSNTVDGIFPNNQYGYGRIDASKVLG